MKNNNKNIHLFAIAALAATLMAGQVQVSPVYAEETSVQLSSLIPDNVTVEEPVPLSDISLPDSEYGTLSWADDSSVPSERVQSYDVVFRPYDSSVLSKISGWDGESDVIYSSVTVVVSSIESDSEDSGEYEEDSEENYDENYNNSETENDGEQDNYDENQESSEVKEEQNSDSEEKKEEQDKEQTSETDQKVTETPSEANKKETAEITEKPSEETDEKSEKEKSDSEENKESDDKSDAENAKENDRTNPDTDETPDVTEMPEATETPSATLTPEATVTPSADKDNIFDGADKEIKKDDRSTEYEENLTEDQQAELAQENHSCNGITVSGIDLPYYVQFRVASGDDYEFSNESEANVFQSYEFELWDLKNNTEYEVPDGEYVSVTVPVKAGYSYTIEHLLDSGAMETIVPSVDGSTMVFSTHSFSPFGIAGSKTLVGEEIEEDGYDTGVVTETPDSVQAADLTPVADGTANATTNAGTTADSSTATTDNTLTEVQEDTAGQTTSSSSDTQNTAQDEGSSSVKAVHTGDTTNIQKYVVLALLAVAAAAIIGVIVYLRKRKK